MKAIFILLTLSCSVYNTVRAQEEEEEYYYEYVSETTEEGDAYYNYPEAIYDYGNKAAAGNSPQEEIADTTVVDDADGNDYGDYSDEELLSEEEDVTDTSTQDSIETSIEEPTVAEEDPELEEELTLADKYMSDPGSGEEGSAWQPWMNEFNPDEPVQNQEVEGLGNLDPSIEQLETMYLAPTKEEIEEGTVFEGFTDKDPDDMVFVASDLDREFMSGDVERNLAPINDTERGHAELADLNMLRRARRRRKKGKRSRNPLLKLYTRYGGVQAWQDKNHPVYRNPVTMQNCERGIDKDNHMCINAMRVELIKHRKLGVLKLYSTPKYARAEACLIFSGLTKSTFYFQRQIGFMKHGYPVFCRNDAACLRKHAVFAACNGVTVCASDCWSPTATVAKCNACKADYCNESVPHSDKFVLCQKFDTCFHRYKAKDEPNWWNDLGYDSQQLGRAKCWGIPLSHSREYFDNPCDHWEADKVCEKLQFFAGRLPYPKWEGCYNRCRIEKCNPSKPDQYDPNMCEMTRNTRQCLNSHYDVHCLTKGSLCTACTMPSMFEDGMFSRPARGGQADSRVPIHVGDSDVSYTQRASQQLTGYVATQLQESNGRPHEKVCLNCQHNFDVQTCMFACEHAWKWRVDSSYPRNETFEFVSDMCRSKRCGTLLQMTCNTCLTKCERLNDFQWNTVIGSSSYRQNYDGFGCAFPCKAQIIQRRFVGATRTADIDTTGQILMDIISTSSASHLIIDDDEIKALIALRKQTKMEDFAAAGLITQQDVEQMEG